MFENRVLRKIFAPKRDEITGKWRKLHYAKLNDLYSSSIPVIKLRRTRWTEYVVCMGERNCVHRVLVGKPEGKRAP